MTSLKAVCSLWAASLHSYFGRQSSYISGKLRLDFPNEKDKFNFKQVDYIVLGFIFASLSGWQAIITGREDISEFIAVFFALSISFWGFSGIWEGLNKAKVIQSKEQKPKKLKAWLIKKGWIKNKSFKYEGSLGKHLKHKVDTERIFREIDNEE